MKNKKRYVSFFVLATAIVMMVYGIANGEVPIVLSKAIRICFECIGLG